MNLEGELGVLKQGGKQVAGLYNWWSRLVLNYTVVNKMKVYQPIKHMGARAYWLVEPPSDGPFDAELYMVMNGELVLMESGIVNIDFPDSITVGRRQNAVLNIAWVGYEC